MGRKDQKRRATSAASANPRSRAAAAGKSKRDGKPQAVALSATAPQSMASCHPHVVSQPRPKRFPHAPKFQGSTKLGFKHRHGG